MQIHTSFLLLDFLYLHQMKNFGQHTGCHGIFLNLYSMMHPPNTETPKVLFLPAGLAVFADDLGNSIFCHVIAS